MLNCDEIMALIEDRNFDADEDAIHDVLLAAARLLSRDVAATLRREGDEASAEAQALYYAFEYMIGNVHAKMCWRATKWRGENGQD